MAPINRVTTGSSRLIVLKQPITGGNRCRCTRVKSNKRIFVKKIFSFYISLSLSCFKLPPIYPHRNRTSSSITSQLLVRRQTSSVRTSQRRSPEPPRHHITNRPTSPTNRRLVLPLPRISHPVSACPPKTIL